MKILSLKKRILFLVLLMPLSSALQAQNEPYIGNGSGNSCVNTLQEFYIGNCLDCTGFSWTLGGPHTAFKLAGETIYDFYWTAPGNYSVSCSFVSNGQGFSLTFPEPVHIYDYVTPDVSISRSPTDNPVNYGTPVTFTATATGQGDSPTYQWFLNNIAVNGETSPQYTNQVLQNNDGVFVRMYSGAPCPSPEYDDSNVITVNVNYALQPPTVSNIQAVYNASATLTAQGANSSIGEVYRWYNLPTGGGYYEGVSYPTPVLLDHTTYYVSKRNVNTGAESARVPQVVTVVVPSPAVPALSANTCGAKSLTRGTPPPNVIWYWQGTDLNGKATFNSALTYNVSIATEEVFYIRAKAATADIWSVPTGIKVTTDPSIVEIDTYQPQNALVQASHNIKLKIGFKVPANNTFKARLAITPECNDIYNWSEEVLYDQNAQPLSRSRVYATGAGRELQSQTIDYKTGKVWVSQPLYDNFNQSVGVTLPAPILEQDFAYRTKFITSETSGKPYAVIDFDDPTTLNNPTAVGTSKGSLGWYYSNNNNLEPQTPTTQYPYARGYTPPGPDPTISTSASPGNDYKMGSGHEVKSEQQLITTELNHYISLRHYFITSSQLPVTGYKFITTDPDGKKIVSFVDADGRGLASATLSSSNTYDNWSYSYYNDLGQLIATVAPKGVVPGDAMPSYVTWYEYNHLGRLIKTTSPDEGMSEFVYSTDGKIRFSRNAEQAKTGRFSYTNYDYLGRLIESGEYNGSTTITGTPYVFDTVTPSGAMSVLNIADNTGFAGVTRKLDPNNRCTDYTFIEYDYQAADLPASANYDVQTNTTGQVTKTENASAKTWYSYDEFGQRLWTKQWIDGLGYKTIDYTYDYFGNVTEVVYQKGQASEDFYHYYEYDKNQNLTSAYASTDGVTKTLQAAYYYYLHGPLKRVELGGNLQGIDYVYNLDGSLKLINHPDPALDPGGDGQTGTHANFMADIFGEALDYNINDYTGAGYNEGNVTLPAPYTDKFSGLPKAIRWHSHTDSHVPRAYAYQYDAVNQMQSASFGDVTGGAGNYGFNPSSPGAYLEEITRYDQNGNSTTDHYDKNGNILGLLRKGKNGEELAKYTYNYQPNTNKLLQVDNAGASGDISYEYNGIGQMVRQSEGGKTFRLKYNAYGLVNAIRNDTDTRNIQTYTYDDRGNRIGRTLYDATLAANPEISTTYYVYDAGGNVMAVYEKIGTTTTLIEVPIYGAGRVATLKPAVSTTFYEVPDHLGNVRGVIGKTSTEVSTTNFETAGNAAFEHYSRHDDDLMDHTDPAAVYKYSQILTTGFNSQVGLAKKLKVSPGDVIKFEAYAKYRNLANNDVSLNTFAASLTGAFGLSAGVPGDPGMAYDALHDYGSVIAGGADHSENGAAPKAFLNIVLFDKNYDFVDAAYKQITSDAEQESLTVKAAHEYLSREVTITEPGYAYLFLSNENLKQVDVYFDDVTITHTHSPIMAGADYYPFGLVMDGREVTDEAYRYGYQGQFSEKDTTTGYNEFDLRFYDAKIARWLTTDPYGQYYSPYMAMGNAPVMGFDADGGWWCCREAASAAGAGTAAAHGGVPFFKSIAAPVVSSTSRLWTSVVNGSFTAAKVVAWYARDFGKFVTSQRVLNETQKGFLGATTLAAGLTQGATGLSTYEPDPFATKLGFGISLMVSSPGRFSPGAMPQLSAPNGITLLPNAVPSFVNAQRVHHMLSTGFDLSGALGGIWRNAKWFLNWLKNNHSLSRISRPLNAIEAQQVIDNAKNLGLPIESNLKGLQGLEITGQWARIPHFKVGNVHIPIESGLDNVLKF